MESGLGFPRRFRAPESWQTLQDWPNSTNHANPCFLVCCWLAFPGMRHLGSSSQPAIGAVRPSWAAKFRE